MQHFNLLTTCSVNEDRVNKNKDLVFFPIFILFLVRGGGGGGGENMERWQDGLYHFGYGNLTYRLMYSEV